MTQLASEQQEPTLLRRAVVLGGLLKRIGNFNMMRNFRDRLIFQKTTYLLQAFGLYLGYEFSWYLYGPYSPGLAKDGFGLLPHYQGLKPFVFPSNQAEQRFEEFVRFLGDRRSDAVWLEAVASVHSLRKIYPLLAQDEIINRVAAKQPYFTRRDAEEAWRTLDSAGLLS